MNKRSLSSILVILAACLVAAGCGGGDRGSEKSDQQSEPQTKQEGAQRPGGVSAPMTSVEKLAGGWMRDIPAEGFEGREGFQLDADGTLHLINIYTLNGLAWQLKGDVIQFLCSTDNIPGPQMSKLSILSVNDSTLTVESGDYFGGTYQRAKLARVTGTVIYRERVALTGDAILRITLRDLDDRDRLVGQRLIYHPGQVPIAFSVVYDPAVIDPSNGYEVRAEIVDEGRLAFVTSQTYPVITGGAPSEVEVLVRPASGGE